MKCEGGIVRRERRESGRVGHKLRYLCTYVCMYTLSTHMHTIH